MTGVESGTHVFPPIYIRNILREHWNAANTVLDENPYIHTEWYNESYGPQQVTVTTPSETSSIIGIDGASGGSVHEATGTVIVGCWGGEVSTEASENAIQVAHEFREEVRRIFHDYVNGISNEDGTQPFSRLEDTGAQWVADPDRSPPVVRYDVFIGYDARKRPPTG